MIHSLLYIFLGLAVIIVLYKMQYVIQERKLKNKEVKEINKNIILKNNINKNEKQNLSTKYNVGTYRDKKGRFRSLKAIVND